MSVIGPVLVQHRDQASQKGDAPFPGHMLTQQAVLSCGEQVVVADAIFGKKYYLVWVRTRDSQVFRMSL